MQAVGTGTKLLVAGSLPPEGGRMRVAASGGFVLGSLSSPWAMDVQVGDWEGSPINGTEGRMGLVWDVDADSVSICKAGACNAADGVLCEVSRLWRTHNNASSAVTSEGTTLVLEVNRTAVQATQRMGLYDRL